MSVKNIVMPVGKYKGTPVDELPVSYCRWMLSQDFPKEIIAIAKQKVEASKTYDSPIDVTRHAFDTFSLRLMDIFTNRENKREGLGSFIARKALEALEHGKNVSLNRHKDDSLRLFYDDIIWVFNNKGEIKTLITVFKDEQ